ncbi:uncharacterized protein LOC131830132 [Mustela lutreola]|uniref:uncharacterized protein LOC131830132 n=1 Tax=Mustela lutreola TaxID=9666 RepID=UPI002797429E|nr:uncharacterized protein LOC131830132 [Mustela lutreola]
MLVTNSGYRDEIQTQLPFSGLASKIWSKDQDKGLAPGSRSEYLRQQSLSSADWAETLQLVSQEKLMGTSCQEQSSSSPPPPKRRSLRLRKCVPAFSSPLLRSGPPAPRRPHAGAALLHPSTVVRPRLLLPAGPSPASSSSPPPRRSLPLRKCVPAFSKLVRSGLQLLAAPRRSLSLRKCVPAFSSPLVRSRPPAPGCPVPCCSLPQQRCFPAFSSRLVLHPPPATRRCRAAPSLYRSLSPPLRAENEHIPGRVPGWQEEWVWSLGQPSKMGGASRLRGHGLLGSIQSVWPLSLQCRWKCSTSRSVTAAISLVHVHRSGYHVNKSNAVFKLKQGKETVDIGSGISIPELPGRSLENS